MAKKDKNYYMEEKIKDSGVADISNPLYLPSQYVPLVDTPRGPNIGQYFNGDSQYDEHLGDVRRAIDQGLVVDDLRARNQSGWDMLANAAINNAVIMGTTAASGILGLADGILEMAVTQDFSKLWDNATTNTASDIQEWAREKFPIYRGNEYQNKSTLESLGTGIFWADLFQNLGFTEGMLIPGMAAGTMLRNAPEFLSKAVPSLVSAIGEASTEAVNNRNDEVTNKNRIAHQEYLKLASQAKSPLELSILDTKYRETLANNETDATKAGNFVFISNVVLLALSNQLQFGELLSRGFGTAMRVKGALMRDGMNFSAKEMGMAMAETLGKKLVEGTSEGLEEVSQSIISNVSHNYTDYNSFNESIFNPEKRQLAADLWSATGQAFAETLGDKETGREFASGFLTGVLGVPALTKGKFPFITLENNIFKDMYDTYKQVKEAEVRADNINARLADNKKISALYNGLVRHLAIEDDANAALDNADAYNHKNSKSAQLINDIEMFDDAGDIELLKSLVSNSIDLSDAGIAELIQSTSKDGEGPFMQNGNPMSIKEVRALLEKKRDAVLSKIDKYLETKQALEQTYPNMDNETLKNSMFLSMQIDDHRERYESLADESYNTLQKLIKSIPSEKRPRPKSTDKLSIVEREENKDGSINFYSIRVKGGRAKRVTATGGLPVTLTREEALDNGLIDAEEEIFPENVKVQKFRGINRKGEYVYDIHFQVDTDGFGLLNNRATIKVKRPLHEAIGESRESTGDNQTTTVLLEDIDHFDEEGFPVFKEEESASSQLEEIFSTKERFLGALRIPGMIEMLQDYANSETSTMPFNEREKFKNDIKDINKLFDNLLNLNSSLKDVLENPGKSVEELQKLRDKKIREDVKNRTESLKTRLNEAKSVAEVRSIIQSERDPLITHNVLSSSDSSSDSALGRFKKLRHYYNEFNRVSSKERLTTQEREDVRLLFDKIFNSAERIDDLNITDDTDLSKLFNDSNISEERKTRAVENFKKITSKIDISQISRQESSTSRITKDQQEEINERSKKNQEELERVNAEAREKAEEKAAREATEIVSEEDSDTSNDRSAELEAHGLSEEDTKDSNESHVTEEEIEAALRKGAEIELETPIEDVQPNQTDVEVSTIPTPKDDGSDQGNIIPETDGSLLGNAMYGYETEPLNSNGKQVNRKGKDAEGVPDKMTKFFNWLRTAGINLQNIIDEELGAIASLSPKLYPMFVRGETNATNDNDVNTFIFLTVEYTPEVAKIHNNKNGGVITSNGKQYLIVGTLGFPKGTGEGSQGNMFRMINENSPKREFFRANPSERFYVNTNMHTKIKDISAGRLVRQLSDDTGVEMRTITELLADPKRNPEGLTIKDLKWGIQYDQEFKLVGVSSRVKVYPPRDAKGNVGSVFLLVKTANGSYIPAYIVPTRLNELKDGRLKELITNYLLELTSPDFEKRYAAIRKLVQLLSLSKKDNNILISTEDKHYITLKKDGVQVKRYDLTDPNFNRAEFVDFIFNELNPRINITTSNLSNSVDIEWLDEAGALTLDLAKIGTSNASYTVYGIDPNGNPIIPETPVNNAPSMSSNSDLDRAQRGAESEQIGNIIYRKDKDGNWMDNTDDVVKDPKLIDQLNYRHLIRIRGLKADEVLTSGDEIFIINSDKNNPLVLARKRDGEVIKVNRKSALTLIDSINKKKLDQLKKEQAKEENERVQRDSDPTEFMSEEEKKKALEGGAEVDLGEISEGQIEKQMMGDFTSDSPAKSSPAEAIVEKILLDGSNLRLSEDGLTYVDGDGRHYARVTSIISAMRGSSERMDPNSPWVLPSTTIGTGIDQFIRDFFNNKLGDLSTLSDRYPNATNEQLLELVEQLRKLREQFKKKGLTVVPEGVTVSGTVKVLSDSGVADRLIDVAGTLDLLAYDNEGNFYIFDMKTVRNYSEAQAERRKDKWAKQLSLYKQLLQEKYGIVVKGMEIIPIAVKYNTPEGAGGKTLYTEKDGQLFADGEKFTSASPELQSTIPIRGVPTDIEHSKLTPTEQSLTRILMGEKQHSKLHKESPVVPSSPEKKSSINETGTKSLTELQKGEAINTAIGAIKSKEYGSKVRALLKSKFPNMPGNLSEIEKFLQEKKIPTTFNTSVEEWISLIENCR